MKDEKKISLSTIEGYRSAIAGTLRHVSGPEVGKDCALSSLLANFARDKTVKDKRAPGWDLAFILESLRGAPYEPLKEASLKALTLKTVFLIALASGRRRGEKQALRPDVRRMENWSEVSTETDINFLGGQIWRRSCSCAQ